MTISAGTIALPAVTNMIGASTAAASGLGQSAFNAWVNYTASKKLMQKQYDLNMRAWNIQNEYNLPVNQMQRLADAGLNPHLVYGNGGASAIASTPSSVSQGSFRGMNADILGDLEAYQRIKNIENERVNRSAEVDNHTIVANGQRDLLDEQVKNMREQRFQLQLENGAYRSFLENRPMNKAEQLYLAVNLGKYFGGALGKGLGLTANSFGGQALGRIAGFVR